MRNPVLNCHAFGLAVGTVHFCFLPRSICVDVEDCEVEVVSTERAIAWHYGVRHGVPFLNHSFFFILWCFPVERPADTSLVRRVFHMFLFVGVGFFVGYACGYSSNCMIPKQHKSKARAKNNENKQEQDRLRRTVSSRMKKSRNL